MSKGQSNRAKELIAELKAITLSSNDADRDAITNELQIMLMETERPRDTLFRILFIDLQLPLLQTANDLNIFSLLCESSPWSTSDLATEVGASPILLNRILRYLAARHFIHEVGPGSYSANNITKTMALEGTRKGIKHFMTWNSKAFHDLPEYFKQKNYENSADLHDAPFHFTHKTSKAVFEKFAEKKEWHNNFAGYMSVQRLGAPSWTDAYPWRDEVKSLEPEQVLFVDIGAGIGHQSVAFREHVGDIPNTIIAQDLPGTIAGVIEHPGVEPMAQDFFTEQQVKGAKIYYMRNIIHDFPDEKAVQILRLTAASCGSNSVVLIDDIVLPATGATWQATQLDLTMMTSLGGMERSAEQFEGLLDRAGLRIVDVYRYDEAMGDSVVECVPVKRRG